MEKRYWFGLALVLLILLGAFCLPWLLLRWEQRQAESRVLTVTEEDRFDGMQLSLAEKHLFLSNPAFVILQETELSVEEGYRIATTALQEAEMLWRGGALDDFSYSAIMECGERMQVHLCVAMTDAAVLRFYSLRDEDSCVHLELDVETEKILRLGLLSAWEQGAEMLRFWDTEKSEQPDEILKEMKIWAQYYGLKLEDVRLLQENDCMFRQEALLTDEDGQRVVFCKIFSLEDGGMGWRSVSETHVEIEENPIQFGAEEDTKVG